MRGLVACALMLAAGLSAPALAQSRRFRAEDAARAFVPAFCTKHYAEAAEVATFDPATMAEWFRSRFGSQEPFTHFRIWDVDVQNDYALVHVRISGETVVHGLYLQVDRKGKVVGLLSIRELLDWRKPELDVAATRTLATLDAIESGTLPATAVREGLREHRRIAALYLDVLDRHLELLEGVPPLDGPAYR